MAKEIALGEVYDCADCGACCRCFPIFALESDAEREPRIREKGVRCDDFLRKGLLAYRLYPVIGSEGCAFLGGDQLCGIYETRPDACRRFEPGSPQCLKARASVRVGREKIG